MKIRNITLKSCDQIVSFDVQNLFTNVPIDEELSRVAKLLHEDSNLEDRTTMSPYNNHLSPNRTLPLHHIL